MFFKKLFSLFFLLVITTLNVKSIVPGAVFFKLHTDSVCYSGYFYDLRDQYHWGYASDQNPSKILWDISTIRMYYSNRVEETSEVEYCPENNPHSFLHTENKIFLTYHDKLWQLLAHEDISGTEIERIFLSQGILAPDLIYYINRRLDPTAKPEGCHAEFKTELGQQIIHFFSTSPLYSILSMTYDGPAHFTQTEFDYFKKFLDLTEFRNPKKEFGPWDNVSPCSLQ